MSSNFPQPGEAPRPQLLAMLVCDQVIRDEATKKASLIGVFDIVFAASFPAAHARLMVYVSVIDAEGPYRLRLELVRVRDEMTVGRGDAEATIENRFLPAEWIFELHNVVFAEPSTYEFRLWVNDRFLASKSLSVIQLPGGQVHA